MVTKAEQLEAQRRLTNGRVETGDEEGDVPYKVLTLPLPDRQRIRITIEGRTQLLTNKISDATIESLLAPKFVKGVPRPKKPAPEEQFEGSIYRDDLGRPCFPAAGIHKALVSAAEGLEMKPGFVRQTIQTEEELLPILGPEPRLRRDTGRNWNAKGVLCVLFRAAYDLPWSLEFVLRYNAARIKREHVLTLVNESGFAVGIGCWRPACGGQKGQYHVTRIEELAP